MVEIVPISQKIIKKISILNLQKKFDKQYRLLSENPAYPSLNVELLEPRKHGIYSFRIDRKYRALFIYRKEGVVEIIAVTAHYQ